MSDSETAVSSIMDEQTEESTMSIPLSAFMEFVPEGIDSLTTKFRKAFQKEFGVYVLKLIREKGLRYEGADGKWHKTDVDQKINWENGQIYMRMEERNYIIDLTPDTNVWIMNKIIEKVGESLRLEKYSSRYGHCYILHFHEAKPIIEKGSPGQISIHVLTNSRVLESVRNHTMKRLIKSLENEILIGYFKGEPIEIQDEDLWLEALETNQRE